MTRIAIVIPAAGASSRMRGADKLLEMVDGKPLLTGVSERACAVSEQVFVTVPKAASLRGQAVASLPVTLVSVPDADEGMAASLRSAARLIPADVEGVMILPADMPDITGDDLQRIIEAFDTPFILQATGANGAPGHPVVFPYDFLAEFTTLTGDTGARSILQRNRASVRKIALPARHALTDLDTPESWAEWRALNPHR